MIKEREKRIIELTREVELLDNMRRLSSGVNRIIMVTRFFDAQEELNTLINS